MAQDVGSKVYELPSAGGGGRGLNLCDHELVEARKFAIDFAIRRSHGQNTEAMIADARAIADFVLAPRT